MRFSGAYRPLDIVASLLGIAVILCFIPTFIRGIRAREWLWLALALYCGALCVGWPNPNARYLVPLLPLIMLGVLDGLRDLAPPSAGRPRRLIISTLWTVFVASLLLCNLSLWGIEVWVARTTDFYARYEGGLNQDLIAAGQYLREHAGPNDGIAVSTKYYNLNRKHVSGYAERVTILLADRPVMIVPYLNCVEPQGTGQGCGEAASLASAAKREILSLPAGGQPLALVALSCSPSGLSKKSPNEARTRRAQHRRRGMAVVGTEQ